MTHRGLERAEERRVQIAKLIRQGLTNKEVAQIVGVTDRTVNRARERKGLKKPQPPRISEETLSAGYQMLLDGCSYAEVARTLGHSRDTWRRKLPGFAWSHVECGRFRKLQERYEGLL
ncbi:helix-turn-helix DNA binding protein [Mycobacterium phage Bobby]|nr:helix-turn-helix DNA binding protein [Mycobacterium phage Bobby]